MTFDYFQIQTRVQLDWHPGPVPDCRVPTMQLQNEIMYVQKFLAIPGASWVDIIPFLAFIEFLCQNGFTQSNIANHLAAIGAKLVIVGLSTTFMQDDRIHLLLKAIKIKWTFGIENSICGKSLNAS